MSLISSKIWLVKCLSLALLASVLIPASAAFAAGSINVSPSTGLANGQTVTVSGSGFAANSPGAIVECSGASNQPTVTVAGNAAPVSCTNPLTKIVTTDASGNLPATSFVIHTGTVGPPTSGTDSAGASAASDAAKFPCPPTAAQIAAGVTCTISFGTASGPQLSKAITFASAAPAPAAPTTPTPSQLAPSTTSKTPAPSKHVASSTSAALVNTGPGDTIAIFLATVAAASLAHYIVSIRRKKASR